MSELGGRWIILRTAGPRTLPLARSLQSAGMDVWTPCAWVKRRLPRKRTYVEREAAILPTFVFVRPAHLPELLAALSAHRNPHPAFSLFRHGGAFPIVGDGEMASLHAEEERLAAAYRRDRDRKKPLPDVGARVRVPITAFSGMTGVVEGVRGRNAVVNFGGGRAVTIGAWLLESGELIEERAGNGIAA